MRTTKRRLLAGVIILSAIVVWAVLLNQMNNWFSVRWLQYQVKKNADASELRQWAIDLLAHHGGDPWYQDWDGTNMPSGLRKVKAGHPNVRIWEGTKVWVFGDRKGSPFLVIAPSSPTLTNHNENILPWQPGVYFVR